MLSHLTTFYLLETFLFPSNHQVCKYLRPNKKRHRNKQDKKIAQCHDTQHNDNSYQGIICSTQHNNTATVLSGVFYSLLF
jgi:hypothetical protein